MASRAGSTTHHFNTGHSVLQHGRRGEGGTVTQIQRLGGDLRLNLHFHTNAFDGVYTVRGVKRLFLPIETPQDHALLELVQDVATEVEKLFDGMSEVNSIDSDRMPRLRCASSGHLSDSGSWRHRTLFLDCVGLPTGDWDLLPARGPPTQEFWSA